MTTIRRLLSVSTVGCGAVSVPPSPIRAGAGTPTSTATSTDGPPPQHQVSFTCAAFGLERDGASRVMALAVSNHTLMLHRHEPGEAPTLRVIPWLSDAMESVTTMAFAPDCGRLALASRRGKVYVLPSRTLLRRHTSRLFQADATERGLPSLAAFAQCHLHTKSGGLKTGPVAGAWGDVDLTTIKAPSVDSPITSLSWKTNDLVALQCSSGAVVVVDVNKREERRASIPGDDGTAGSSDVPSVSSERPSFATADDVDALPASRVMEWSMSGARRQFVVWTDTAVYVCSPLPLGASPAVAPGVDTASTVGFDTSFADRHPSQLAVEHLQANPVKCDSAVAVLGAALGLPTTAFDADDVDDMPPMRAARLNLTTTDAVQLGNLLVQTYATCRALLPPTSFSSSTACSRQGEKSTLPRKAANGVVGGVDVHDFLATSELYHSERAVSWLVFLGCPFEALLVGCARGVLNSAFASIMKTLGPLALDDACVQLLTSRNAVSTLMLMKGGDYVQILPPKVLARFVASDASMARQFGEHIIPSLALLDAPTLELLTDRLRPVDTASTPVPPSHTVAPALPEIDSLPALPTLEDDPTEVVELYLTVLLARLTPADHALAPVARKPSHSVPGDATGAVHLIGHVIRDTAGSHSVAELDTELRRLRRQYNARIIVERCLDWGCYRGAATVCEVEGDPMGALSCRLLDLGRAVAAAHDEGAFDTCAYHGLHMLSMALADARGLSDQVAALREVLGFWARTDLPMPVLCEWLSKNVDDVGLALGQALFHPPPPDNTEPLLMPARALLAADRKDAMLRLELPPTLVLKALVAVLSALPSRTASAPAAASQLPGAPSGPPLAIYLPYTSAVLQDASHDRPVTVHAFSCGHRMSRDTLEGSGVPKLEQFLSTAHPQPDAVVQFVKDMYLAPHDESSTPIGCPDCVMAACERVLRDVGVAATPSSTSATPPHTL